MISIIICSRNNDIPSSLKKNIHDTIGTEYELIVIDNSQNNHSIFSAYNEGVALSKGDILCFMHEDITYIDRMWGNRVKKHFKNVSIGLIGVLGGHFIPHKVCHIGDSGLLASNYIYSNGNNSGEHLHLGNKWNENNESEVVAVDGLWFCIKKELFERISFDTRTYSGFHYYDMDISMQVWEAGYSCAVVNDILIEHRSAGVINQDFIYSAYDFYKKWEKFLPITKGIEICEREMNLSTELCEYKRYCREIQFELEKCKTKKSTLFKKITKKINSLIHIAK